jgi:hypothetical protein
VTPDDEDMGFLRMGLFDRFKKGLARTRFPIQTPPQLRPAVPFALLEFAQVRDHPMPRTLGRAVGFHQRPIGVPLAVLASFEAFKKRRIPAVSPILLRQE